jgi:drug/metabolite transporter (DMT)-like permease
MQPVLARWRWLVVYTVVELAIPWVLLSTAEQRLPSSLSGLLVAAVPLVGAVLSWAVGGRDKLGSRAILGLLVGLAGVGALVGFDVHGGDAGSVAIVGVVVIGYAAGPIVLDRRLGDLPKLGVVAASLVLCAVGYAPFALTHLPSGTTSWRVVGAVVVLGVVCTALAFVLFFHLIAEIGPVRATVITYVNPAVAVVLGVVFLHEHFGAGTAIGFGLVLTGSVLATGAGRRAPALVGEP